MSFASQYRQDMDSHCTAQFRRNDAVQTPPPPPLPTELWLYVLEHAVANDNAEFLWCKMRCVSRKYKAYVERLFKTRFLPNLTISLPLPLRDTTTGALLWPGEPIPGKQLKMKYSQSRSDEQTAVVVSPVTLIDQTRTRSVEELRASSTLTKERLQAAKAWVSLRSALRGCVVDVPVLVEWDDEQKIWVWGLHWRELVSAFYNARKRRNSKLPRNNRRPGV
jgi:hypothetical protein